VKKGLLLALVTIVAGFGASCGLLDSEVPTAEVGECITNSVTGSIVDEFDTVDCTESHTAELYYKFELPDGDFPGTEEISSATQEQCTGANFEDYVGVDYASSEIEVYPVTPTEETWNDADDREVLCFGGNLDGTPLTESIEGIAR
jgi:hypothetical protein